jgi:TatD DNase family protein
MAEVCDAAVARAGAAGVSGVLLAGVDAPGWRDAALLRARLGDRLDIALAYGVHPQVVGELAAPEPAAAPSQLDEQLTALARAARGEPLVAGEPPLPLPQAIGELGLDGRDLQPASPQRLAPQERAFRAQLALARQLDLPLVLHVVRAHAPVLRILKGDGVPRRGGVVHSYSGSAELVADYLRLGLHISFAGPVTYPEARRVHAAVKAVPSDRLLVETDAPDQTPWARRPAACEPAFLPEVLQALALHRGQPWQELAVTTEANARRLFDVNRSSPASGGT